MHGGHLNTALEQLTHDRIHFIRREHQVAHDHDAFTHGLECEPSAKGECGFDRNPVENDVQVRSGKAVSANAVRLGCPGSAEGLVDGRPVCRSRLRDRRSDSRQSCGEQRQGQGPRETVRTHGAPPVSGSADATQAGSIPMNSRSTVPPRTPSAASEPHSTPTPGPISKLTLYFFRLGTLGFGGPVALCGLMERELVSEKAWLTRAEMRDAIAISQSMPGPLAIQVGIFASYMRGGFWGAWAGGWAFILPNFLIVAGLAAVYVHFGGLSSMTAVFYGVSPAVIALILLSCWRLSKLGMEHWLQ